MTSTSGPAQKAEERMATKDFVVFDGDSHVVEPPALWEKYLDPEYRMLGKHALWRQEGRTGAYLKVNGEIFRDKGNPNLPRHALWRPGMDWDAIGALDPHVKHSVKGCARAPALRQCAGAADRAHDGGQRSPAIRHRVAQFECGEDQRSGVRPAWKRSSLRKGTRRRPKRDPNLRSPTK
jgi:hypothetical protein